MSSTSTSGSEDMDVETICKEYDERTKKNSKNMNEKIMNFKNEINSTLSKNKSESKLLNESIEVLENIELAENLNFDQQMNEKESSSSSSSSSSSNNSSIRTFFKILKLILNLVNTIKASMTVSIQVIMKK